MIDMSNWFIGDNELSTDFENFSIKIKVMHKEYYVFYPMQVFENNEPKLTLVFYSLKEAVNFAVNEIANSGSVDEVLKRYNAIKKPVVDRKR